MELELAKKEDLGEILELIAEAQEYFRSQGIDQWQNGYPNADVIGEDIANGWGYALRENGHVIAYSCISLEKEPTYSRIEDGKWHEDASYGVLHRVAVRNRCKGAGAASLFLKRAQELCREAGFRWLRMDTHRDNLSMQKFLRKNGFLFCGIIHLADGSPRLAFDRYVPFE